MTFEFKLPDIGEGLHEADIVKWKVKEGESVKEDQPMLEVMTDKATVEITCPKTGRIGRILAGEGKHVNVGDVIVTIEVATAPTPATTATRASQPAPSHSAPSSPQSSSPASPPSQTKEEKTLFDLPADIPGVKAKAAKPAVASPSSPASPPSRVEHPAGKPIAAPAVRQKARDLGLDLWNVAGSGPAGRITHADLAKFSSEGPAPSAGNVVPVARVAPVAVPGGSERIPITGVRKKIAENMRRSKDFAAHFTFVVECDVTELVRLREEMKGLAEKRGVKLTYMPFFVRAACAALRDFPGINAKVDDAKGEIVRFHDMNIGIAAHTPAGLVVPVVKQAQTKSILTIGKEIAELGDKARAGKLAPADMQGGTFTITSPGKFGGLLATPVINYPEVAIMGVHEIKKKPAVVGDQIMARDMVNLSFSFDHRIIDGVVGAEFAYKVAEYVQEPRLLLLEGV